MISVKSVQHCYVMLNPNRNNRIHVMDSVLYQVTHDQLQVSGQLDQTLQILSLPTRYFCQFIVSVSMTTAPK